MNGCGLTVRGRSGYRGEAHEKETTGESSRRVNSASGGLHAGSRGVPHGARRMWGRVSDAGEWIRRWVRWPAGEGDGALRAPKPPAETVRLQSTDGVKLEGGAVGDGDAWVLILHEYPTSTLVGLDGYRFAKFSGPPRTHASRPRRRSRWL